MGKVLIGDSLGELKNLPSDSVDCCITSPPYYGLRDYGMTGQIGLEPSPEEYVKNLVEVFREVRRVLKDEGTFWLNIADSYAGSGKGRNPDGTVHVSASIAKQGTSAGTVMGDVPHGLVPMNCKPKDLIGIPWMLAFALRADGWCLRQEIIWQKENPMPESVKDRCTKSHESVFLFSKTPSYFFDSEAISEPAKNWGTRDRSHGKLTSGTPPIAGGAHHGLKGKEFDPNPRRNKRDVWNINVKPFRGAHFAVFPIALVEPMILAGTSAHGNCVKCGSPYRKEFAVTGVPDRSPRTDTLNVIPKRDKKCRLNSKEMGMATKEFLGWKKSCQCEESEISKPVVLDPFMGSGTTLEASERLGRDWIGIDLNPEYAKMAESRIKSVQFKLSI